MLAAAMPPLISDFSPLFAAARSFDAIATIFSPLLLYIRRHAALIAAFAMFSLPLLDAAFSPTLRRLPRCRMLTRVMLLF